jgi:hypothetical protein
MNLLTFSEAIDDALRQGVQPHLMIGNGFSIACRPDIFLYGKLFEQADFSPLSPYVKGVFAKLKTQDFEKVIKFLRDAYLALQAYDAPPKLLAQLKADADGLRELLVQTIAASHPAWPGEITEKEYSACRKFLKNFKCVYTFNYDLLLYWTQMHVDFGQRPTSDDGFRTPYGNYEAEYVTWEPGQSHEQNMWFLHGALHVFDSGTEVQKYTWNNTGTRLIDQIREAIAKDFFPIFVSEGTSAEKYERIRHNDYLAKAYRSFSSISGTLFILGHSLAENDEHYLKAIERGKITRLYVGIHGDPSGSANKAIISRAKLMVDRRRKGNLSVEFFDSSTAKVWGK